MDEKLKAAYENLEAMLRAADNEGFRYLESYPREDGKIEITSDGDTYVVTLEPK